MKTDDYSLWLEGVRADLEERNCDIGHRIIDPRILECFYEREQWLWHRLELTIQDHFLTDLELKLEKTLKNEKEAEKD